ncbi:cal-1, partial [Symbiodinium necroappetens]
EAATSTTPPTVPVPPSMLICLLSGASFAEVLKLKQAGKQALRSRVVEELLQMYPELQPTAVEAVQLVSFSWDPSVLGSWTSGKVGSSSRDFSIFQQAIPGMAFAGEHTCRLMYGTAQAAIVSGARAAHEVLAGRLDGTIGSAWPFFDKELYSLCDELAHEGRREHCGLTCPTLWTPLPEGVPSLFQDWQGMPKKARRCWSRLGWRKLSWMRQARKPASGFKKWLLLSFPEKAAATCLGFSEETWNAASKEMTDIILCRSGSTHLQFWDCLTKSQQRDWQRLGIDRSTLNEELPSAVATTGWRQLTRLQRKAAIRIGYRPWLCAPEVCSTSLAHAWAKFEAKQRAWKEEQEDREIRLLEKEEVASRGSQRLPFMAFERGVEWERPGAKATAPPAKLPSLSRIMHSIQSMNFSDQSLSVMTSGSLRSNPAFGGSGHCRGGPKLPLKHSKKRLESLLLKAPRKSSPTRPSSKSKNRKRAAWGGGLETHEFRVDTVDLEEPLAVVEAQAPEPKTEEKLEKREEESDSSDSSSLTSDSSSVPWCINEDSSSDLEDSSEDEAMMLPLLDSNNQPVRRSSVAEAFLKKVEDNGVEGDNDAELDFPWSDEECRSVFIKFDTDTDGEVATEELQMMLRYMGCILRPGEIERLVKDMFSYATVSWEEWMTFLERYREVDEQYLREEFAAADADGNGVLDVQELRALLNKMGYVTEAHTVQEAMDTIGCGVSGCVNLRKFEKLREHLRCTEGLAKDDVQELRTLYDRMARTAKAESRSRKVDIGAGSQSDIAKKLIAETQEMPVEDVSRLVRYLGYSISADKLDAIAKEVDNDESGYISFQELLKLIRRVRDAEREAIASVFDLLTEDGSPLQMQDLPRALVELKYFPSDDLIFSILDDLYPLDNQTHMTRDQIASFLREFREREGLTHLETADIREAFDHQCKVTSQRKFVQQLEQDPAVTSMTSPKTPAPAKPESATKLKPAAPKASALSPAEDYAPIVRALDSLQASRVMRWFNFAKPMQEVQQLLEQFDLDGTGKLEFEGFLKLMHGFFLEEREKQWNVFAMLDSRGNGHVPVSKLPFALTKLYDDTSVGMTKRGEQAARTAGFSLLDTKNAVSRSAFELFCRNFRKLLIQDVRHNACYTPSEVVALRDCFDRFDKDKSGTVENTELAKIIAEYFPEATKSKVPWICDEHFVSASVLGRDFGWVIFRMVFKGPSHYDCISRGMEAEEGRAEVQIILKDVDQEGLGRLSFSTLLVLMRRCDDIRDERDLHAEKFLGPHLSQRRQRSLKWNRVAQRQVVDELGLDYEEVEGFRQIFDLHSNWVRELTFDSLLTIISRIADMSEDDVSLLSAMVREVHPEHRLLLRFPHFLQVMRRLTDENTGNINHACSRVLRKQYLYCILAAAACVHAGWAMTDEFISMELRKKEEALETLEDEVQIERRRSVGGEATAEPVEFHMADEASLHPRKSSTNSDQELDPELSRARPATLSRVSDETSVVPLPDDHQEDEEVEADEMWDMDWTAVTGRTATGAASAASLPNHEAQGKGYPDSERLLQHKLEEEMG